MVINSSFRDPSGFVFVRGGVIYRQVNPVYKEHYDFLVNSGLCSDLIGSGLLINFKEVQFDGGDSAYKIIKPEMVDFISYPYEWSFSQLKDMALTTLVIQKKALSFGMTLKDSSAYNMQFVRGKSVLIDTLSFEKYCEGKPWVAYRQFCQHFLAPLALMAYKDIRLNQLLRVYLDGIPLDLASSILPLRSWLNMPLLLHIHLHAKSQRHYAHRFVKNTVSKRKFSRTSFMGLVDSLEMGIRKLKLRSIKNSEWDDYYTDSSNYDAEAVSHKKQIVSDYLDRVKPSTVWDLGANTGMYSRIASEKGAKVICFDSDPLCVERNYQSVVKNGEKNILPLVVDFTNPSPGIGWANSERIPLWERGHADVVLALALIHHLVISDNVPLGMVARLFSGICSYLIIEFVPKSDSNAQKLLASREDIFTDYTQEYFEKAFGGAFTIMDSVNVVNTGRVIYLMERKRGLP